ncbi:MAG: hypothetical protein ABI567_00495 [Gammaproteobacteria bacterium]
MSSRARRQEFDFLSRTEADLFGQALGSGDLDFAGNPGHVLAQGGRQMRLFRPDLVVAEVSANRPL